MGVVGFPSVRRGVCLHGMVTMPFTYEGAITQPVGTIRVESAEPVLTASGSVDGELMRSQGVVVGNPFSLHALSYDPSSFEVGVQSQRELFRER